MVFDSERISRKQERYEKSRAYNIIETFKSKNLNNKEILACIEVMILLNDNTETQTAAVIKARNIIIQNINQELIDASNFTNLINNNIN
jgi:hypothetical protein